MYLVGWTRVCFGAFTLVLKTSEKLTLKHHKQIQILKTKH